MYKCKQHIHELFWVASRFLKKIICNELYLCTRNKDGIRRILNCKCTGDFWLLCVAQSISSFISVLILNMQSWLCLLCSSYFSLQQSGLESATRARCRAGSAPPRASPRGPAAASPAWPSSAPNPALLLRLAASLAPQQMPGLHRLAYLLLGCGRAAHVASLAGFLEAGKGCRRMEPWAVSRIPRCA